jgi:hypothetical protein
MPKKPTMITKFSEHCIYTIVRPDRLAEAARNGGPTPFRESKPWVTGYKLWQKAQAASVGFPILLGDATDCSRLTHWGLLTNVRIKGATTHFTVDRVRRLHKVHKPQELELRSSGKHIKPNFIRPYAICCTPRFVRASNF